MYGDKEKNLGVRKFGSVRSVIKFCIVNTGTAISFNFISSFFIPYPLLLFFCSMQKLLGYH